MFSRKEQLIQRTGEHGIGRFDFLKLLVTEFKTTKSKDAKQQVLANLANFAYDPVNYEYLQRLKVIDLFLLTLSDDNKLLVRFAIGGICNLCLDVQNKEYILRNQGIWIISSLLSSSDEETVLSAITTLMFLMNPTSKKEITSSEIIKYMLNFSESANSRIKNLAQLFLMDFCEASDIDEVKKSLEIVSV